jgi:DNA-3-methyladenine glycosylase I
MKVSMEKDKRCFGDGAGKELYADYHDREWGIPVHEERRLFEMICLEGAQAGLSWETILKKRKGYRCSFHDFQPTLVAEMTDHELEELVTLPEIVRHRGKIYSVRENARVFLAIQREFGTFNAYLWKFVNHKPLINHWKKKEEVPSSSEISDALSKDLKKRGMSFVGSTIMYAFMQAVGMVNDHLVDCPSRSFGFDQ